MTLVDRAHGQRTLTAMSRTRRSCRIRANADVLTTTYAYDANGNLIQAGGWSYMWDYLNRMLSSGFNNSTTTYAYDEFGSRVMQTSTTSTTYYPNKYYSFTSTKSGANTYATSTNYVFNGDTLLATIDQPLYNGAATGSPITRYIHPDHLGSTNAVTDQNGSLVQLMDYYPYGATRLATSTYPTNEKRQYIGQFSDVQTNLNYLQARYYDSARGQFVNEDPVFWGGKQNLTDPQSLNAYSYAQDNPVTKKDPTGLTATPSASFWQAVVNFLQSYVSYLTGGGGSASGSGKSASAAPNSGSNNGTPAPSGSQAPYYGGGGGIYSPTILNIAPQNGANDAQMPEYANVYSPKYGYSKKLPRDFQKIKGDAENGDLQYRGQYVNGKKALPPDETYSEYTLPTPEMAQDLNLPPGTVGPERVIEGDSSGDLYYTASHYIGRFLDLKNGNIIPGEGGESIPLEF